MKLLAAVSVADHVVSADWLYACGKAKAKVDEAAYAVVDAAREKEWRFSLAASLAANARGVKVLAGYAVAVAPGAHDVAKLPANPGLKDMVECAGGAFLPGQDKRAKFQTSKPHISAVSHSFWLIFGRAIISRNGLEA